MWVLDAETLAFLGVNNAATLHYGYARDEFAAMTLEDISPPEDGQASRDAATGAAPERRTWKHRRKDGSVITVEITGYDLVFEGRRARLMLANDVTDRIRLEEQLRQSHKMGAIRPLAP